MVNKAAAAPENEVNEVADEGSDVEYSSSQFSSSAQNELQQPGFESSYR